MSSQIIYNAQWAKENISMPDLLRVFGHEPVRSAKQGNEYWYISPFRYEKEPSFHTSFLGGKWIWNDFGRSDIQGSGTVIGFLELHENVNVRGALKLLKELFPTRGHVVQPSEIIRMPLFKELSISNQKEKTAPIAEKLVIREIKDQVWDKGL